MRFTKNKRKEILVDMEQTASSSHFHHQGCTKHNPYTDGRAYNIEQEINRKISQSPKINQANTNTYRTARRPRRLGGIKKAVLSELPTTQQNLSDPIETELRPAKSTPWTGREQHQSMSTQRAERITTIYVYSEGVYKHIF
jgi:hypothetical protein